ncbi:Abi family protein [Chloroflexota bacterium]
MQDYNKPPNTYEEQLRLLESRGLITNNPTDATKFLGQVNYYRFTAYCIPFQKPHDVFLPGTTFEATVNLYQLDEQLRDAVFALLTPIEIFLRTRIAYELSHKWGTFAHYDDSMFKDGTKHKQWLNELENEIEHSNEPFLKHYKTKYNGFPRLPIWMACEIMSLGKLSLLYSYVTRDARSLICSVAEVHHDVFKSWLHAITYVRNICAHHGLLWSRTFSISPRIPDKPPEWQAVHFINNKLFAIVAIMEWICRKADLPTCNVEPVYEIMQRIATLDTRFTDWMGVPTGQTIKPCWKANQ